MVNLPKDIKNLFYNPKTDSVSSLLSEIKKAHLEILNITDLNRCTLKLDSKNDMSVIPNFRIPIEGLPKHLLPKAVASLFHGIVRWHSPKTMYNVAPPTLIHTVTAKAFTSLYNPNLCLDTASGKSLMTEQNVISAIADFVGWDPELAGGTFTWGGKATIMYGIKMGLKKCYPDSSSLGVKEDIVVLSTVSGHPSHISDADWLGIGSANVMRLKTKEDSRVDIEEMERVIRKEVSEGKKIAAIVISGGTTNNMVVDPIEKIVKLRDKLVLELDLNYSPHIHVDTVVAFPWIFFKNYDFELNPNKLGKIASKRIFGIIKDLKGLYAADSFGVDFHKMGFCPYVSCVFMIKDKTVLYGNRDVAKWPFMYTIENSRSADGPNSAFIALNSLGVNGFQKLIAHLTEMAIDLQSRIIKTGNFEIINSMGLGTSVMFIPRLPDEVSFESQKDESRVHDNYTSTFIKKITEEGNPYYIDLVPGNSTGANPVLLASLKVYIMSPYSTKKTNQDFVDFLIQLKRRIDLEFDFHDTETNLESELPHPLK